MYLKTTQNKDPSPCFSPLPALENEWTTTPADPASAWSSGFFHTHFWNPDVSGA